MPWLMTQFADAVGGEEDVRKAKTCSRFFFPKELRENVVLCHFVRNDKEQNR